MGSYFGQDYTAFALTRLAELTEDNIARVRFGADFGGLSGDRQAGVRDEMRRQLQKLDLTQRVVKDRSRRSGLGILIVPTPNQWKAGIVPSRR